MSSINYKLQGVGQLNEVIASKVKAKLGEMDGTAISIVAGGARGQAKNTLIAKVQAGLLRNPFYVNQQSRQQLRFLARGLTSDELSTRLQAIEQMGQTLLMGILQNVDAQRNSDGGRFKPLTPAYAAYKRRKFGFVTPILRATGDLLLGLKVVIDKLR